jgi:hypothetical protein
MSELVEIVRAHRDDDGAYRLSDLAIALGDIRDTWQPVLEAADGTHRHWRTVYEDDEVDVYAISWLDGQTTGFHDHCDSSFGVACVHGAVFEERPRNPTYAPKLLRVGQIYVDSEGRWVRRERDGREELTEGLLPC